MEKLKTETKQGVNLNEFHFLNEAESLIYHETFIFLAKLFKFVMFNTLPFTKTEQPLPECNPQNTVLSECLIVLDCVLKGHARSRYYGVSKE